MIAASVQRSVLIIRSWGGIVIALALVHAAAVTWVAWYVADVVWTSAPLSASRTPLSGVVFSGTCTAAVVLALVTGALVGASVVRGGVWARVDPTRVLPIRITRRLFDAWCASAGIAALATIAVLPVYLAIAELGGATAALALRALGMHAAAIAVGPLVGIAVVQSSLVVGARSIAGVVRR